MSGASAPDRRLAQTVACVVAAAMPAKPPAQMVWPAELFRRTRGDEAEALARQVALYLLITRFGFSCRRAGEAVGRDRTTASHSRDVIRALAEAADGDGFADWLEEIGAIAQRAAELAQTALAFEIAPSAR